MKRSVPLVVWRVNVRCEVQQQLRGLYAADLGCAVKRRGAVLVALHFAAKPVLKQVAQVLDIACQHSAVDGGVAEVAVVGRSVVRWRLCGILRFMLSFAFP